MEPFPDIENMTLERFYNNFMKTKGDPRYRFVNLGLWSVDIKERLKYFTADKDNTELKRFVLRGSTHERRRPDNSRFIVGSNSDSLTKRSITDDDWCWLGFTWYEEFNNGKLPSLSQIEKGLIAEAMVQIELAMGKIKD